MIDHRVVAPLVLLAGGAMDQLIVTPLEARSSV